MVRQLVSHPVKTATIAVSNISPLPFHILLLDTTATTTATTECRLSVAWLGFLACLLAGLVPFFPRLVAGWLALV